MADFGGSEGGRDDLGGSLQQVGPLPTAGERAAHLLLFQAAVALVAAKRGDRFPAAGSDWEETIAAAAKVCPDLTGVTPGGLWPADLVGRVAVLVAEDGAAMLLATEMLRAGAFPEGGGDGGEKDDPVPELEVLTVHCDGRSYLGVGDATAGLLAQAPKRAERR
ncbi:MAG TPA: hypothetical protein VFY75_00075 [Solirubrobacterales bacterium]|nr:hypothetical protein [Solirubrobacterales bacterium]